MVAWTFTDKQWDHHDSSQHNNLDLKGSMEAGNIEHATEPKHGKHGTEALGHEHQPVGEWQFLITQRVNSQCVRADILEGSEDVVNQEKHAECFQVSSWVVDQKEGGHREHHAQLRDEHPRTALAHAREAIAVDHGAEHEFANDPWNHTGGDEGEFLGVVHRTVVNEEGDKNGGDEEPRYTLSKIQRTNGPEPSKAALLHVQSHGCPMPLLNLILIPADRPFCPKKRERVDQRKRAKG